MTTKIITLEGPCYYAKIFEDNRDMKGYEGAYEDCNGAYEITVALDDVEHQKLNDSGSKVQGVLDDEGFHRCKFKRKHEVRNRKNNEIISEFSGPPRVVDADGELWPHTKDMPSLVGNESRVLVAVSVTPDKKKPSIVYTRLEGVQVLDHVEYVEGEGGQMKLPF